MATGRSHLSSQNSGFINKMLDLVLIIALNSLSAYRGCIVFTLITVPFKLYSHDQYKVYIYI